MFELCGIRITEVLLACEGVREIQIVSTRVKSSRRFSIGHCWFRRKLRVSESRPITDSINDERSDI